MYEVFKLTCNMLEEKEEWHHEAGGTCLVCAQFNRKFNIHYSKCNKERSFQIPAFKYISFSCILYE